MVAKNVIAYVITLAQQDLSWAFLIHSAQFFTQEHSSDSSVRIMTLIFADLSVSGVTEVASSKPGVAPKERTSADTEAINISPNFVN